MNIKFKKHFGRTLLISFSVLLLCSCFGPIIIDWDYESWGYDDYIYFAEDNYNFIKTLNINNQLTLELSGVIENLENVNDSIFNLNLKIEENNAPNKQLLIYFDSILVKYNKHVLDYYKYRRHKLKGNNVIYIVYFIGDEKFLVDDTISEPDIVIDISKAFKIDSKPIYIDTILAYSKHPEKSW